MNSVKHYHSATHPSSKCAILQELIFFHCYDGTDYRQQQQRTSCQTLLGSHQVWLFEQARWFDPLELRLRFGCHVEAGLQRNLSEGDEPSTKHISKTIVPIFKGHSWSCFSFFEDALETGDDENLAAGPEPWVMGSAVGDTFAGSINKTGQITAKTMSLYVYVIPRSSLTTVYVISGLVSHRPESTFYEVSSNYC